MTDHTNNFLNVESFHKLIEDIVDEHGVDYLDAVMEFCSEHDMEPEDINLLMSPNLKDKIMLSAIDRGLMNPISQLPL